MSKLAIPAARFPLVLALVGVALVAAACGSAAKSSSGSGSDDPAAILSAIDTTAPTAPQKVKLEINFDLTGTPNSMMTTVMKKPIHLSAEGVVDAAGDSEDITLKVTTGTTSYVVRIVQGGRKSWIQIQDKWYVAYPEHLSYLVGPLVHAILPDRIATVPSMALAMIGDPTTIFAEPSVSHEDVEGVATDKVSGGIDIQGFVDAFFRVGRAMDPSAEEAPAAGITAAVTHLERDVTNDHVDLWVGSEDHRAHRVAFAFDVALDKAEQEASGFPVDHLHMDADASSVDTDAPEISAPASAGTPEEFIDAFGKMAEEILGERSSSG